MSLHGLEPDARAVAPRGAQPPSAANLADILERVLDKGIVIAGDIQINLLDIELLTIKVRLLVASVDKAREMGINWWEGDRSLTLDAREAEAQPLEERVQRLEAALGVTDAREQEPGNTRLERPASDREGDERGDQ